MRIKVIVFALIFASAAQAQDKSVPLPKPLYHFPGLPDEPTQAEGDRPTLGPIGQLFVSPAGEPFRAPPDRPYPIATWFAQADANHDGKVDRPEFSDDFDRFFGLLDVDHDNAIDPTEIARYERELVPEVGLPGGINGQGGSGGPGFSSPGRRLTQGGTPQPTLALIDGTPGQSGPPSGGPPPGADGPPRPPGGREPIFGAGVFGIINNPEPVASMDINLDGRITRAEMNAASYRRFALLDSEGRGFLTLNDLPRTLAQSRGLGKKRRKPKRGGDFPDF